MTPGADTGPLSSVSGSHPKGNQALARAMGLPFFLVHLGYKIVRRYHALPQSEFAHLLHQAAGPRGTLQPAHHILWRAELQPV